MRIFGLCFVTVRLHLGALCGGWALCSPPHPMSGTCQCKLQISLKQNGFVSTSSLSVADRLGAESKAKRAAVTRDNQCPEWFSKPTTLKSRFVFLIRALITYLPNSR